MTGGGGRVAATGVWLWFHEFADTAEVVTASFAAGGDPFTAIGPSQDRNAFNVGLSLKLASLDAATSFRVAYEANLSTGYVEQMDALRLDFAF